MRFTAEPKYIFTPDINGNLALSNAERLTVEIIRPTSSQRGEFEETVVTREYYPAEEGKELSIKKAQAITRCNVDYILKTNVGALKNCVVDEIIDDSGNTKEVVIENGIQLAQCAAYGIDNLVKSIVAEIYSDTISSAQKKIYK